VITFTLLLNISISLQAKIQSYRKTNKSSRNKFKRDIDSPISKSENNLGGKSSVNYKDAYQSNKDFKKKKDQEIKNHVFNFNVDGKPMTCKGKECEKYLKEYPWLSDTLLLKSNLQKYSFNGNKFGRNSAFSNRHIDHAKRKLKKMKRINNRN